MGYWGMGITQSDEYMEIYDRFMDAYNKGKDVVDIKKEILAEYLSEFDADDGVLHDVYFAIGKAEWMCGGISEEILAKITEIIESGANIEFYRELEATEKDLKQRQTKLEKFLTDLQTPRGKTRQRRIDPLDRVKELPPFEIGDCYRYKYEDGYRVFVVLGYNQAQGWRDMVRCGIFQKTYALSELKTVDYLREQLHSVLCYRGEELPAPSSVKKITTIYIPDGKLSTSLDGFQVKQGHKKDFKAEFNSMIATTPAELIDAVDSRRPKTSSFWSEINCGDVFAYQIGENQYRLFALMERKNIVSKESAYCYAYGTQFERIPSISDIQDEAVMPLGYFFADTLPKKEKLTYIGKEPRFEIIKNCFPHLFTRAWAPAINSIVKIEHLSEEYPPSLLMKLDDMVDIYRNYMKQFDKANENTNTEKAGPTNLKENKDMSIFSKKPNLKKIIEDLLINEIVITTDKADSFEVGASKFGGNPDMPRDFAWPHYEGADYDEVVENRPLVFLAQINLEDVAEYDVDGLLPKDGVLSFFYEVVTQKWGFDPDDVGCAKVFYFEKGTELVSTAFPGEVPEEYNIPELALSFESQKSYPSFEELECYSDVDADWDDYDKEVEKMGFDEDERCDRHKLLGYADLIQGEILSQCERIDRGLYCGDPESYRNTPDEVKKDIAAHAKDWILLFQLSTISDDDTEIMWGDCGSLYFYIRREDLAKRDFSRIQFSLQCG